jgi:hypothetical protein
MSSLTVDFKSVDDFRAALTPLIQQLSDTLTALSSAKQPPLGYFHDAILVEAHHQAQRTDYLGRVQQLVWALIAERDGNDENLERYIAANNAAVDQATDLANRNNLNGLGNGPGNGPDPNKLGAA